MCTNVANVASNLMKALEPELQALMNFENVSTAEQQIIIAAYDKAYADLSQWQSGTYSQELLQAFSDFVDVFDTLPIPSQDKFLADTILATIKVIVGLITSHSPAPPPIQAPAAEEAITPEAAQEMHIATTQSETEAAVKTLAPDFKLGRFHKPEVQQKNYWNKKVSDAVVLLGDVYAKLKVA